MVGTSYRHGVVGHEFAVRIVALYAAAFIQRCPVATLCIDRRAVRPAAIGRGGLELPRTPAGFSAVPEAAIVVVSIDDKARRIGMI